MYFSAALRSVPNQWKKRCRVLALRSRPTHSSRRQASSRPRCTSQAVPHTNKACLCTRFRIVLSYIPPPSGRRLCHNISFSESGAGCAIQMASGSPEVIHNQASATHKFR